MNTNELITSVKRRAAMPTSQNLFSTTDFISLLNEDYQTAILPLMLSIQEDFYLEYEDFLISDFPVDIPSRAIGQKVKTVGIYSNSGKIIQPLSLLAEDNSFAQFYFGYAFEGYRIKLVNTDSQSNQNRIRVHYYRKPNDLAASSEVSTVIAVDPLTNTVSISALPVSFVSGATLDFQGQRNPFSLTSKSRVIQSITGVDIVLDSVEGVAVGNFVALEGQAYVPNLPIEMHQLLAQKAAVSVLESQGKADEVAVAMGVYNKMELNVLKILTPRSDGQTSKFLPVRGIGSYVN